jgi:[histone H4]-N-methyl-L-lysine20 N-methyltransferase
MSILRDVVIGEKDLRRAEGQLLALPSLKKFSENLKSASEKNAFRQHMMRYLNIYLPDCPFEISGTNQYKMTTHEATIITRKPIKAGQEIKYLCGIRTILTEEEEVDLDQRGQNSSIIVTTRPEVTSSCLFGPIELANHEYEQANTRFTSIGRTTIKATAVRDIKVGKEITFSYARGYFKENNCKYVCKACEILNRNDWLSEDRIGFYPSPEASLKYKS